MLEYKEFIQKYSYLDNTHGEKQYARYLDKQKRMEAMKDATTAPQPGVRSKHQGGLFIPIPYSKLESPVFRKKYASALTLYAYIRRYLITGPQKTDKYDLYGRFYKSDNKFVATLSFRRLASDFGCSVNTIRKWVRQLLDDGMMEVEHIKIGKGRVQSVYILGGYQAGKPVYYIDEVPLSDD